MKLYEISAQMEEFLALVEAGEIPEEAIADTLEGLEGVLVDKLDDCAAAYKGLLYEAEAIKAEKDKLGARLKSKKAQAERLKDYIDQCMKRATPFGEKPKKLETARSVLNYRKTESVTIDDIEKTMMFCTSAPAELDLVRVKEPEINKEALKKALKEGVEVPGAGLEVSFGLTIK